MFRLFQTRTLIIAAAGIAALGGIVFLLIYETRSARVPAPSPMSASPVVRATPHVVGDEKVLLERVKLSVVYFVPRDRQELIRKDWTYTVEESLDLMRAFHRLQFHGKSDLVYEVAREPVIGEYDGAFYDGTDTNRGNPNAWGTVLAELDRRLGKTPSGQEGTFAVRLVLYEGVGALGGDHQILASSGYLGTSYAATTFYHELGHTFGLKDAYNYESGAAYDEDVMGLGRQKPIGQVYLSDAVKRELGIIL
ncbi:MAG: hypothetical protein Q7S09_02160 [bacterium]|nr:hypothetical protein [bacterium]